MNRRKERLAIARPRLLWGLGILALGLLGLLGGLGWQLHLARQQPVGALLVLGGSIRREMAAAEWARSHPGLPILISGGAPAACVAALYERAQATRAHTTIEACATSTFDNYAFSLPRLQSWQVRRVVVLTSPQHLPRAAWLGQILLGSRGLWVEVQTVSETGVPANRERPWVTALDVLRALGWAIASPLVIPWYSPTCGNVQPLGRVDWVAACQRGLRCERQADLAGFCRDRRQGLRSPS